MRLRGVGWIRGGIRGWIRGWIGGWIRGWIGGGIGGGGGLRGRISSIQSRDGPTGKECSRKPGRSKRPLKLHGKPAKQEALVINILDCTSWHRGESGVGWAGDGMRWDGWGEIGIFCSGGKLACHARDSNFMMFINKGTQRLSSRTHV